MAPSSSGLNAPRQPQNGGTRCQKALIRTIRPVIFLLWAAYKYITDRHLSGAALSRRSWDAPSFVPRPSRHSSLPESHPHFNCVPRQPQRMPRNQEERRSFRLLTLASLSVVATFSCGHRRWWDRRPAFGADAADVARKIVRTGGTVPGLWSELPAHPPCRENGRQHGCDDK